MIKLLQLFLLVTDKIYNLINKILLNNKYAFNLFIITIYFLKNKKNNFKNKLKILLSI